jgi:hypothetical protein
MIVYDDGIWQIKISKFVIYNKDHVPREFSMVNVEKEGERIDTWTHALADAMPEKVRDLCIFWMGMTKYD